MKPFLCLPLIVLVAAACRAPVQSVEDLEEFAVGSALVGAQFEREYVGKVHAVRHVEFRARLKGVIESVGVDEGQWVRAGQVLFGISATERQQELEKARALVEGAAADLKAAQIEQASTKQLFDKKVISNTELEVTGARVASLAARLREAKANEGQAAVNLSYGQVRAPFDGVVNRIPRKVGSLVLEDDLLTTMTDTSEVFVYFRVSEQEYLAYAASQERHPPVALVMADGTRHPQEGVIDSVESEFDEATGNIAFRARFPNPGHVLKHGATGKVVIKSHSRDAIVVPQRSTFEIQENLYLFTVDTNDVVHATRIIPKMRLKDSFVVESGLTANDRFILEGVQKVKDGARIIARPETLRASSL